MGLLQNTQDFLNVSLVDEADGRSMSSIGVYYCD